MSTHTYYAGAIWTNHVLQRLTERGLPQEKAAQAFSYPDRTMAGREAGSTRFEKRFGPSRVTVIAKKTDRNEWLIVSAWIDPPLQGTADARKKQNYRQYQKASVWKKIWLTVLQQLGLFKY